MKTNLKYRTFDQLLSEVALDFRMYNLEGMLDPANLIKVAQQVNYLLGLKINQTKETILEIENGKAKLPDDFDVVNHAFLLHKYFVTTPALTGTHREDRLIPESGYCSSCGYLNIECCCHRIHTNDCGTHFQVVEKVRTETRVYEDFEPVEFKRSVEVSKACLNSQPQSQKKAEIKNGFVYLNASNGRLYISYQGAMEDEDGNLLVLDHPLINEYYEYALKSRLLENLFINGEDVAQKIQLIDQRLRAARNNALSLVNTPDFAELKGIFDMNRKAQYNKYYSMFASYSR